MKTIRFVVEGTPVGKGRPRMQKNGHVYTPEKTREYEQTVYWSWRTQSGESFEEGTPLRLSVKAHFPIPKSTPKSKRADLIGRPYPHKCDADNILKSIADGISGSAFHDDAAICYMEISKDYQEEGSAEVELSEWL